MPVAKKDAVRPVKYVSWRARKILAQKLNRSCFLEVSNASSTKSGYLARHAYFRVA
jgi:hypothetical protein